MQNREAVRQSNEQELKLVNFEIDKANLEADQERDILKAEYKLKRDKIADPRYMTQKRAEVIHQIYNEQPHISTYDITSTASQDPFAMLVDNFVNSCCEAKQ